MHIEVELKLRLLEDNNKLHEKLSEIADTVVTDTVEDVYFSFRDESTQAHDRFRLRISDSRCLVSAKRNSSLIKDPNNNLFVFQVCEEIEFDINRPNEFVEFVDFLGFGQVNVQNKQRQIYKIRNISAEINNVLDIGVFLEVEILCTDFKQISKAMKDISEFVTELNLTSFQLESRWYTEINNKVMTDKGQKRYDY